MRRLLFDVCDMIKWSWNWENSVSREEEGKTVEKGVYWPAADGKPKQPIGFENTLCILNFKWACILTHSLRFIITLTKDKKLWSQNIIKCTWMQIIRGNDTNSEILKRSELKWSEENRTHTHTQERMHTKHTLNETKTICLSIKTIMYISFHRATVHDSKGKMLQNPYNGERKIHSQHQRQRQRHTQTNKQRRSTNCYSLLIISVCSVHKHKMKHTLVVHVSIYVSFHCE